MNKKYGIAIGVGVTCCIVLGSFLITKGQSEDAKFFVSKKSKSTLKETYEYGSEIPLDPSDIKLTLKIDEKDVTKELKFKKVNFRQLRTYKINYTYKDEVFTRHITIVDKTSPTITGKDQLEIMQESTFDNQLLELQANDNYDGDITSKITFDGVVDTATPGSYVITARVQDTSGNEVSFVSTIQVKEKPKVADNTQNNNGNTSMVISNPYDISAVVNKQHMLPDGWAPGDLAAIQGGFYLRAEAAQAWNRMMSVAASEGVTMNAVSAYRSQAYQTNLYNRYYATDPINAPYYSALPRRSEHELGLALDISYGDYQLHEDLESTATGIWLNTHGHEFGWIMRYPSGKSHITGYIYEAWHYRYVGVDLATSIKASGLTLEEYLGV